MKQIPKVFSVNYFLRTPEGKFCTHKLAKRVWMHWAEGRCHGEYGAYETPTGFIPKYEDLKVLFKELFNEDYTEADYKYQFSFRCNAWVAKIKRTIANARKAYHGTPSEVYAMWDAYIAKIEAAKAKYGAMIPPGAYKG